jgi:hypothetical protein
VAIKAAPETKSPTAFASRASGVQIAALAEFVGEPDFHPRARKLIVKSALSNFR